MPQSNFSIPNESGALFRSHLNTALQAIVTQSADDAEPATMYPFQFWVDTSGARPILKMRNADNTAWITVGLVDVANFGLLPLTGGVLSGGITYSNTDSTSIPVGTTLQRPGAPATGMIRYNTDLSVFEIYVPTYWAPLVARDVNGNVVANNFVEASSSIASAGGTTTLSVASARSQVLTGTQAQTFKLPDATTLSVGWSFEFNNNSTGALTVKDFASTTLATVPSGGLARLNCLSIGTGAGSWDVHYLMPSSSSSAANGSTVMIRDQNGNTAVNNIAKNFSATATAAGTTTLTAASSAVQQFTGTTTQTIKLPDATTLSVGMSFTILNRSTGSITVQNSGGVDLQIMTGGTHAIFHCSNIGSANGTWDVIYIASSGDVKSDGTVAMSGQFKAANGNAGAPGIAFNADQDVGFFSAANNAIGLATAGIERMRWTTDNLAAVMPGVSNTLYPAFLVRAWAQYNGSGNTVSASGNISSITNYGTGQDWVNFSTAMPNVNYAAVVSTNANSGYSYMNIQNYETTRFMVLTAAYNGSLWDGTANSVIVLR